LGWGDKISPFLKVKGVDYDYYAIGYLLTWCPHITNLQSNTPKSLLISDPTIAKDVQLDMS
jgi:hypothetical protein